nr:TetR family transcriptional regulator [Streptomyces sp. NEAU-W12]
MSSNIVPPPPPISLIERRKAETRMEIARVAADLFVRQGLKATRAEDVAQAAGIAPRTFYRYFAAKEEAVAPLYEAGARRWVEAVRTAPPGTSVPQALEDAARSMPSPGAGVSSDSWGWVRTLVRLADAHPSLRRVWAEVCQTSERALAEVLASRMPAGPAADNDAGRAGHAVGVPGAAADARLRFAAAVASAAVRAAVEGWAAGDGPGDGPQGPAELAVANLAALRHFPWDDLTAS